MSPATFDRAMYVLFGRQLITKTSDGIKITLH
jgi:hypothetical protein